MNRKASAEWKGSLKEGSGTVSMESGVLTDSPYSYCTRFENAKGTNPEELVAAAHAGCFSMAFSMILGLDGMTPDAINTEATVTMEKQGDGFAVTASHLDVVAKVPGADAAKVKAAAEKAKAGCPISKLLNAKITMDLRVE